MISPEDTEQISDEEAVVLALKDQEYFVLIIDRYKSKLFNYIRRITSVRDEDVEDLLQEIFLKVYLNLNDFDSGLKFSSWIYAIARNQVISNHRRLNARAEGHSVTLEDDGVQKIMSSFNMEKELDKLYLKEKVEKVLFHLHEKYREVLILKFIEEKNYQEISDIIKKPMGTVGSLMNKAKSEFKKELDKQKIKI
jgi:RNA polymerase sigma-70 factor (ECF subfamily)